MPRARAGVLRGLELLTLVVALAACDRASGRAKERAGDDPFVQLGLLRAKVPPPATAFTVPGLGGRPLSLAEVGVDPDAAVARVYAMRALPTTYLIDDRRDVVAMAIGARNWDGPTAHAVVEALLR